MAVGIIAPQRKEDAADKIIKGLTIANGILGTVQGVKQAFGGPSDVEKLQKQRLEDEAAGVIYEKDIDPEKLQEVAPDYSGAIKRRVRGEGGVQDKYLAPRLKAPSEKERLEIEKLGADTKAAKNKDLDDLRKERESNPITKATAAVAPAISKIRKAAENPSAASDIALVYGFMKINDPNSTVREGEFATAQNAGSVPDRVIAAYNKALNGERLAPEIRSDFVSTAEDIFQAQVERQNQLDSQYATLAKERGYDPKSILFKLDESSPKRNETSVGKKDPSTDARKKELMAELERRKKTKVAR